jgi:hypothetical protein
MARLRPYLLVAALAGLGASVWAIFYGGGDAWIAHNLGLYNETGPWYAFWSGFGSDIAEYAVFGAVVTGIVGAYRRHNCNVKGCWRLQWREYIDADGVKHLWCKKHHPSKPVHSRDFDKFLREHEARKHAQAQAQPQPAQPQPAQPQPAQPQVT